MDLGHLGLAREVLAGLGLDDDERESARARIAKRDRAGLAEVLRGARGRASGDRVRRVAARAVWAGRGPGHGAKASAGPPGGDQAGPGRAPGSPRRARTAGAARAPTRRPFRGARVRLLHRRARAGLCTGLAGPGPPGRALRLSSGSLRACSPAVGFAIDVEATAGALELRAVASPVRPATERATEGCWSVGPLDDARDTVAELRRGRAPGRGRALRPPRRRAARLRSTLAIFGDRTLGRKPESRVARKSATKSAPGRARPRGA